MMNKKKILFLILSGILSACSVKEDRSTCPCVLRLDFSATDTNVIDEVDIHLSDYDSFSKDLRLPVEEYMPEYQISVPRSELNVNIFAGDEDFFVPGKGIMIPSGSDCPEIYMHSAVVDTNGETAYEAVHFSKNHCVMTIDIARDSQEEYRLCMKGNVCGYALDGSPSRGDFLFRPKVSETGVYKVVLPRQTDSSLTLEIDDGTDVLKTFAIGEYVAAGGYDWEAADLEDLHVTVDWTMTELLIKVQGWDWVYEYEIII